MRSIAIAALVASSCSTGGPAQKPHRGRGGVALTGTASFDACFLHVEEHEARAAGLEARVAALFGPVATALELPASAPAEDVAAALRKAVKRAARAGAKAEIVVAADGASGGAARLAVSGAVPPTARPGLEAAAAAVGSALALRQELREALAQSDRVASECAPLSRTVGSRFANRGSDYVQAVARELADAERRLEAAAARLRAADDSCGGFAASLRAATAPGG
jgi:hypothetical protein